MQYDATVRSTAPQAAADYNQLAFEDFGAAALRFTLVADCDELNRAIAREAVDLIKAADARNRAILMILPVGPLDYRYWSQLLNEEQVSCAGLMTMGMDEYLDAADHGDRAQSSAQLSRLCAADAGRSA